MNKKEKLLYRKAVLVKYANLKEITRDQPDWQCSFATNNGIGNNGCDNGNHNGQN